MRLAVQCREISAVTEGVYKGVSNPWRGVSEGFSKAVTSDFRQGETWARSRGADF